MTDRPSAGAGASAGVGASAGAGVGVGVGAGVGVGWTGEVIDEQILGRGDRTAAGELLARAFDYDGYHERGHREAVPEFRVLIRGAEGALLGHRSAFRLETEGGLVAYGMGDAAVREEARGQGIGAALVRAGVAEAKRRGAQAILTYTDVLAGVYRRLGFRPAEGLIGGEPPDYGELALLWLAAGVAAPSPEDPLRVAPTDF